MSHRSFAGDGATHLLFFPWLAFGHISPYAHLARKLLALGGFRVSFLSAAPNADRIAAMLPSTPDVSVVSFPLAEIEGLSPGVGSTADVDSDGAELLKIAVDRSKPQIDEILRLLRPDIVLFDFAMPWVPSLAGPLGAKALHFSVFAPIANAYITVPARSSSDDVVPTVDDMTKPPAGFPPSSKLRSLPRCQAADLLYVFRRYYDMPSANARQAAAIAGSDGIVLKGCKEIEGEYISYIASQYGKNVYLAGQVVPDPPLGELDRRWSEWLDGFGEGEVIFSSFGSETFLSTEATRELLLGLEISNFPFLVALNVPNTAGIELPGSGFAERVRRRGAVHLGWVPQQQILRHRAVGCFVCHAGLSSVVEGLLAGCRLVLLPQKTDQYLNAALFADDLGVATKVERADDDGRFAREGVFTAVRAAMSEEPTGALASRRRELTEFLNDAAAQEEYVAELGRTLKRL